MMKIGILGAGFSGLATAWHLLRHQANEPLEIVVFDPNGIGGAASGIAAGLLHCFGGPHAKLSRLAREGLSSTRQLLEASKAALNVAPFELSGLLRPALLPIQAEGFFNASKKFPSEIQWLTQEEMQYTLPGVAPVPGIYIPDGITVYAAEYLKGLWLACENLGATFEKEKIVSLEALQSFDKIVVAMGAHCTSLKELGHLPLSYTKGQILELEWPDGLPPLLTPLNSHIYCLMLPDKKRCLVGSTYEKQFGSAEVDPKTALQEILPKIAELYPPLERAKVIDCRAGIRVSTPQHMPLLQKISDRCYVLTGMGSKGLLYHALYAQSLAEIIVTSSGHAPRQQD